MRLVDLDPKWEDRPEEGRFGLGIWYTLPGTSQRICTFFENPLDGGPPKGPHKHWKRTGDTFETLTLTPSVDAFLWKVDDEGRPVLDANGERVRGAAIWHGHITNGVLTP